MKHYALVVILALFANFVFAQKNSASKEIHPLRYIIQLGNFESPERSDFATLTSIGYVYAQALQGELYQVYLGGYNDEKAAKETLKKVKSYYPDAFLSTRKLSKGKKVYTVQIAISDALSNIDWTTFAKLPNLNIIVEDRNVFITSGVYATLNSAREHQINLKELGYEDAFVKNTNSLLLHPIGQFESGEMALQAVAAPEKKEAKSVTTNSPSGEMKDLVIENESATSRGIDDAVKSTKTAWKSPVAGLQQLLKAEKLYTGVVDGIYGKSTEKAMNDYAQQNDVLKKYSLQTNKVKTPEKKTNDKLEIAIAKLNSQPDEGLRLLAVQNTPLAMAYRAYGLYIKSGVKKQVNDLMNQAIQKIFPNGSTIIGFDAKGTYSYTDIGQILQHLSYIHQYTKDAPNIPCWMFKKHTKEASMVFEYQLNNNQVDYCIEQENINEVNLVTYMAKDIANADISERDKKAIAQALTLLNIKPLSAINGKNNDVSIWYQNLWSGLDAATSEKIDKEKVTAFKAAFWNAQIKLEDFYTKKNLNAADARTAALYTLHQLVGTQLMKYC
ncbi:MAG: SPOR domain-containing protein [Saprospiraceae bacterium]|nr:SPOR domain-containing protein [Saprospiraceae bacterium]